MFKARLVLPTLAAAILCSAAALAQKPAGAPAGANGTCKDGTYSMNATKSGACSGHKGVAAWYGPATATTTPAPKVTPTPAPAATIKPVPTPAAPVVAAKPAPAPAPMSTMAAKPASTGGAHPLPATAAAGGGPGLVWVNSSSKVYHCPTDRYYGKTKAGKYISEQAAIGEGDKADSGKKCF
jgi:hypothetical protein